MDDDTRFPSFHGSDATCNIQGEENRDSDKSSTNSSTDSCDYVMIGVIAHNLPTATGSGTTVTSSDHVMIGVIAHDLPTPTGSATTITPSDESFKDSNSRDQWGNSLEFLMSCIAMSVGLGNIWRFPFTAYENGGGAFLIPYFIVLILVGRPVYYLEMCLGQFSGKGNVHMFEAMAPILKGIGFGQVVSVTATGSYYSSIIALTLYYLLNSFTSVLPWSVCKPEWENCVPSGDAVNSTASNGSISSSELYFGKEVLHAYSNIDDGIGLPDWKLSLLLLWTWVVIFILTVKGVKILGKAAYFLAIFPYVVLFILLIKGSMLEGAVDGILYFINPDFEKLLDVKVWYEATVQCFFSLSVGFGTIIMYSSYNKFNHNVYRDALVVSGLDTFTSIFAGITIFGILGHLAHKLGVPVSEVVKTGGAGLAFISYPDAIAAFEHVPWLFSILFFFMLFTLGIGSVICFQACLLTVLKDCFPKMKTCYIAAGVSTSCFLLGLVYVTPGGQFILELIDYYGGTFVLFILTTLEVTVITWWYGVDNFCLDIEFMLKRKVGFYWRICWGFLTPSLMLTILIYFLLTLTPLTYGLKKIGYPIEVEAIGWTVVATSVFQIPLWWMVYLFKNRNLGFRGAILNSFDQSMWRPKDEDEYRNWKEFKNQINTERQKLNYGSLSKLNAIFFGR